MCKLYAYKRPTFASSRRGSSQRSSDLAKFEENIKNGEIKMEENKKKMGR